MYSISFYENGKFVTLIGGPLRTIGECLQQISKLTDSVDVIETEGYVGCKWNRNGTACNLLVVNEFGIPVRESPAQNED